MKSLFKNLFGTQLPVSDADFYIVKSNRIEPLEEPVKNNSINGVAEHLGCDLDQIHTVVTFNSKRIETIIFKRRTREPIFFSLRDKNKPISYPDLMREIDRIDWGFENRQLDYEDSM